MSNNKIINFEIEKNPEIKNYPISISDFDYTENNLIGTGGSCSVYKVKYKPTNKYYALKIIDKNSLKDEKQILNLNEELKLMISLNNPNILKLITFFEDIDFLYILLPLCKHGQLYNLLHKNNKYQHLINKNIIKKYLIQIINALIYLHSKKIIHRDIKADNILIDDNDNAILCDFGIATVLNEDRKTFCGTLNYLAPEMLLGKNYDEKIDVWAIGIVIYECFIGNVPFDDMNVFYNEKFREKFLVPFDNDVEPILKDLIVNILKIEPEKRMKLENVVKHPFFFDVDLSEKNNFFEDEKNFDEKMLKLKENFNNENNNILMLNNNNNKFECENENENYNKLKNENEILENRIKILNNNIKEYQQTINEKNEIINKIINKETEENLIVNFNNQNKNNKFINLLISSNYFNFEKEKIIKNFSIIETDNFSIINNKINLNEKENEINENILNIFNEIKTDLNIKINNINNNFSHIKNLFEKNDFNFHEKLLNLCNNFNNIIEETKNSISKSIENTIENTNKIIIEKKDETIKFLNEKIENLTKIKNEHELNCLPKIENLNNEITKWKVKFENKIKEIEIKKELKKEKKELEFEEKIEKLKHY